jgi:NADH-quinone oxidoreductase subunit M
VIGYSSVSHMGYVVMGLATIDVFGVTGAVLQMFSHGVMTALFFAMVGVIYSQSHVRDIAQLEGLAKRMGMTSAFFAVAGLASLGLPGLSGFVAELMVFIGVFKTYLPLGFLAVIGAAITAVYILRLLGKVFFGPLDPRWERLEDLSRREFFAALLLIGFLVLWGLYPWPIVELINSAVVPMIKGITG